MAKLTYRRRTFVQYYCGQAGFNGTQAARLAGYAHPTMEGARLLANASVRAAVEEHTEGG
jgi:phage terminase small subunit